MADKKLLIKLAADVENLKKDLNRARKEVDSFSSNVKKVGGVVAAAFSARAVGEFVLQVSKLAGEAQGVREAFDRLPNSVRLMSELKDATHGTVSELDLMKRSVMAANFDISLEALPRLLEFATIRAKQTGQSVDYLVDSIVTGIGRKSKLILDNLGISAVQLTEALGGASTASATIGQVADAVGKIAGENLKKMGSLSENASTKIEQLGAAWGNVQVFIGNLANGTGVLAAVIQKTTDLFETLTAKSLTFWEKFIDITTVGGAHANFMFKEMVRNGRKQLDQELEQLKVRREADRAIKTFGTNLKAIEAAYKQNINYQKIMNEVNRLLIEDEKKKAASIRNEKNLTEQLNSLREEATLAVGKERAAINQQVTALENEIAALQRLGIAKDLQEKSDAARAARIAASERNSPKKGAAPYGVSVDALLTDSLNRIRGNAFESMKNSAKSLAEKVKEANEAQKELQKNFIDDQQRIAIAATSTGDIIAQSFGDMISGSKTFAQAMAQMASQVVAQIEKIVLARMIENSFKYANPVLAIGAAAAGFGIVKSLFNRIGGSQGQGTAATGNYGGYGNRAFDRSVNNAGMNIVQFRISGNDLVGVTRASNTYNARVKTVYTS